MKCPTCETCDYAKYCGAVEIMKKCDRHNKKVEQTNEEFLRSASANDMARCIATKLCELAKREYGIYDVVDYATIFEWLKEVHK